jgi:hypothetical protein
MATAASRPHTQGVRKTSWLIVTALVLLVFTAAHGAGGFFLGALVVGVPYLIGCVLHPRTTHRACRGTGYHRSPWYLWGTRRCRGCQGGIQVRHGARVVGLPHVREEHEARTRQIAKRRQDRTWR